MLNNLRPSFKAGFGFGLTSAIITTLGLMIGLYASTQSKLAVIGGILTIAVADAFSDALGMHISVEYSNRVSAKEIWEATISTFFAKFVFASLFLIPVLLFPLNLAMAVSVVAGLVLLAILSYIIARQENKKAKGVIFEHVFITIVVVLLTYYLGSWIAQVIK